MDRRKLAARADDDAPSSPFDILRMARASVADIFRIPRLGRRGLIAFVGVAVLAWASTSFYRIPPNEKGVVPRLGRWVGTTDPGLHIHWPWPIEAVLPPKR